MLKHFQGKFLPRELFLVPTSSVEAAPAMRGRNESKDTQHLPVPLVDVNVDLARVPSMPLTIERLQRSKDWLICKHSPEMAFYMVNLWTSSWYGLPAGSLECNDHVLADLAMCDPQQWAQVKPIAMHNWVLCSDGRYYHPALAEVVQISWMSKLRAAHKTEKARIAKHNQRHGTRVKYPGFEEWLTAGRPAGQPLPVHQDSPRHRTEGLERSPRAEMTPELKEVGHTSSVAGRVVNLRRARCESCCAG